MGEIISVRKMPSDFALACDKKLEPAARREAWNRYEKQQWADAHFLRGLKLSSLEQKFAVFVAWVINNPDVPNKG